jgi:hypothetical protein
VRLTLTPCIPFFFRNPSIVSAQALQLMPSTFQFTVSMKILFVKTSGKFTKSNRHGCRFKEKEGLYL